MVEVDGCDFARALPFDVLAGVMMLCTMSAHHRCGDTYGGGFQTYPEDRDASLSVDFERFLGFYTQGANFPGVRKKLFKLYSCLVREGFIVAEPGQTVGVIAVGVRAPTDDDPGAIRCTREASASVLAARVSPPAAYHLWEMIKRLEATVLASDRNPLMMEFVLVISGSAKRRAAVA
jgi:hypothetical protein